MIEEELHPLFDQYEEQAKQLGDTELVAAVSAMLEQAETRGLVFGSMFTDAQLHTPGGYATPQWYTSRVAFYYARIDGKAVLLTEVIEHPESNDKAKWAKLDAARTETF